MYKRQICGRCEGAKVVANAQELEKLLNDEPNLRSESVTVVVQTTQTEENLKECEISYLYQGFVRMNLGIDGLFKIIRLEMKDLSPVSGDIFLFFGKNRQSVKILRWDLARGPRIGNGV